MERFGQPVRKLLLPAALLALAGYPNTAEAAGTRIPRAQPVRLAHGGFLTGHWQFDFAIILGVFAGMIYFGVSTTEGRRGLSRLILQGMALAFGLGALLFAVIGFRDLIAGTL